MLCSKRPPPSPASKLVLPADGEARSAQRFHKESREAVQHPFSQSPTATLMLSVHDRHLSCRSSEGQSHLEVRLVTPLMQQLGANLPETSGRLRTFKMSLHLSSRTFFSPDTTATNSAFFFFFFIIVPKYTYGLLYQSLKFLSLREGVYAIYFLLYNCRQEAKKKPLWACGQASLCPSSPYSWEDREGCLGEGGCFAMDFPKDGRKTSPLLCESPPAYGCTQKADRPVVLMRGLPG